MSNLTAETKDSPRIACYRVPNTTWAFCVALIGLSLAVKFSGSDIFQQAVSFAFFALTIVSALNFFIPFTSPNTILGGAKLRTLALAISALVALVAVQ